MDTELYEVIAVRVGTRDTHRSDVYLNYHLYGERDGPAVVDYFFWILRNSKRTVIVDTGFGTEAGERRGRHLLLHPVEALERLGIHPGSVKDLVVTHGHYDHVGNVDLFPSATIHMAESEYEFWTSPVAGNTQFSYYSEDHEIDQLRRAGNERRLRLFTGETSVASGIRLVEVGGHTPGQAMVYVSTTEGVVLLASDAVHFYEELERDMPFTAISDLPRMYEVFENLRGGADKTYCVLIPGHDRDVLMRYPQCEDLPPGEAIVIGKPS
ncbi:N-acyl homoserine lactonase family protein [Paenarthrobacter sp. YAF11_1]|uniref:N-acyl homoserine lactonase family protein n=1 Tax=Paenarthrobacter sp. YAF11_1 TaxID=3233074 RepID=UPI003F95AEF3